MKIDINCDVGEGIGNEVSLMPYISSCNIACGGHFGNKKSIDKTIKLAKQNNVLIGAHPSFPDKENFGRKNIKMSKEDFTKSIQNQIDVFINVLKKNDAKLHHIKPHGALYNVVTVDELMANLFLESIKKYLDDVFLYVPFKSVIERIAKINGVKIKYEAFADRNYNANLTLVSRNYENALKTDKEKIYKHVLTMVNKQEVLTICGTRKFIKADTFCVHGDTKNAIGIVKYLYSKFV